MADNKKLNLPEFRKSLAEELKKRVEEFSATCEELKKKEMEETMEKKSPPGKAKEVEELKAKGLPASEAFAIAWKQYKTKKSGAMTKDDMSDSGMMGDMSMSKKEVDKKDFPSIADSYEDAADNHPSTAAPSEPTVVGKKKDMAKSEMCDKCGKEKSLCKCMGKTETYIDPEESNSPDPKKRLKTFGGKGAQEPVPCKEIPAPGSGEGAEALTPLKKDEMKPGHELKLQPVGDLPKPDHSKVQGHVARLHEKAKAKMAKSDPMGTKGTEAPPTIAPTAPAKAPSVPSMLPGMSKSEKMPEGSKELKKAHIGFNKLKNKLVNKKGVSNPAAVAAAIGRKKYGAKGMAAKAKAGKK